MPSRWLLRRPRDPAGRRRAGLVVLLFFCLAVLSVRVSGCGRSQPFVHADPSALGDPMSMAWYEACRRVAGVHVACFDGKTTFVLASLGEIPAGHRVEFSGARRTQNGYALSFHTFDPSSSNGGAGSGFVLLSAAESPAAIVSVSATGPHELPWPAEDPANAMVALESPLPGQVLSSSRVVVEGYARTPAEVWCRVREPGDPVILGSEELVESSSSGVVHFRKEMDVLPPEGDSLEFSLTTEGLHGWPAVVRTAWDQASYTPPPPPPPLELADLVEVDPENISDPIATAWVEACRRVQGVHEVRFNPGGIERAGGPTGAYVLAALGPREGEGWAVSVSGVSGDTALTTLTFTTTGPATEPGESITYPFFLYSLPVAKHPKEWMVQSNGPVALDLVPEGPAGNAIVPTMPLPGDKVNGTTLRATGYASVWEGNLVYRLVDGSGVIAEGHVTLSPGAPRWARYDFEIRFSQPASSSLILRLGGTLATDEEESPEGPIWYGAVVPLDWRP